jgi:hypothetical protein
MKTASFLAVLTAIATFGIAGYAPAHHSFSAVFDPDQPIEFMGRVTEIEWMNPHVWFYLDVEAADGTIENWGFEMGSPNGLIRRGWRHDALQEGQLVSVIGVLARDGSRRAAVRSVLLPDGKSLFGAQDESR